MNAEVSNSRPPRTTRRMKKQAAIPRNLRYFVVFTKMIRNLNVPFDMILADGVI
jgi:hypothetical protein